MGRKKKEKKETEYEQPQPIGTVEEQEIEPLEEPDEKTAILLEYKQFKAEKIEGKSTMSSEDGQHLFSLFNAYTGRKEKFTACSLCVRNKIRFFNKQLEIKGL